MSSSGTLDLRYLDQILASQSDLETLAAVVNRIERCGQAVSNRVNIADIIQDEGNFGSLIKAFGAANIDFGLQLLLKLTLEDFEQTGFTTALPIDDQRKMDFLYRSLGGWKQFEIVISFQIPTDNGTAKTTIINPREAQHWRNLESIPEGTLVTAFIRTASPKRSLTQERLALERIEAAFEVAQNRTDTSDIAHGPAVEVRASGNTEKKSIKKPARRPLRRSAFASQFKKNNVSTSGPPVMELKVVINKMDTFLHAGNAQLILTHLKDYSGRVNFYVLRAEKKKIQLDADSMWGAEIRNGETVVYEFFGDKPEDDFLKELAKKTNKYTQMDKLG